MVFQCLRQLQLIGFDVPSRFREDGRRLDSSPNRRINLSTVVYRIGQYKTVLGICVHKSSEGGVLIYVYLDGTC